jgi:hypothetical protein
MNAIKCIGACTKQAVLERKERDVRCITGSRESRTLMATASKALARRMPS